MGVSAICGEAEMAPGPNRLLRRLLHLIFL